MALTSFQILQQLMICQLEKLDQAGKLEIRRHCIVPGEIAWDNCDCGQLVIAEQRRYPSRLFPLEEIDHTAECGAPWLVIVALISLARCVSNPDNNGNPPSCVDLEQDAFQLNRDMGIMRSAAECCLDTLYNNNSIIAYELGAQEIQGPEGGCVETNLMVQIGITNGCGCG